jgi:FtsP/CotA-like multicopper oxidase with cupredoxin domain
VIIARTIPALVLVVAALTCVGTQAQEVRVRHYYLAAEDITWNYAPTGREQTMHGGPIPEPWRRSLTWRKTRFVEYTDDTFTAKTPQAPWLGVLGPILRAEVGDTIQVHFLNRSRRAATVHPHGVRYTKESEGAHDRTAGPGGRVAPGARFTYTWTADEESGPAAGEASSKVWWYHSHVDEPADVNAGLLGPLVITARGRARPDATPVDVDREFVALMMIFDEARGKERGLMHSINGFVFGNVPGLVMKSGERVRWYLLGMGNEKDLHTLHWHGKTAQVPGRRTDVVELLPGSMVTADMRADNPGTWMIHCHVADHFYAGMYGTYTIEP